MVRTNPDGQTQKSTEACIHTDTPKCHCDNYVWLTTSRPKENEFDLIFGANTVRLHLLPK